MVNSLPGFTSAGAKASKAIGSVNVNSVFVVISPFGVFKTTNPGWAV